MSTQRAVDLGLIIPGKRPKGWGLEKHEIPIGRNLFLDQGLQAITYAFGNRSPINNYVCKKVGFGTGTSVAKVTDVALESPIEISSGVFTKDIDGVDWPAPFIIRVTFTIGAGECNGYFLTEFGLFTGSDILVARKIESVGINKSADIAPVLSWRLRL